MVAKGLDCFNKEAQVLDTHLAKQPYLVGKELTLADFSVAAPLFYADRAGMPLAPYAKVRDWFARVSALPLLARNRAAPLSKSAARSKAGGVPRKPAAGTKPTSARRAA